MEQNSEYWKEELNKCKNGTGTMTGKEYYYYNYYLIDGKLPEVRDVVGLFFKHIKEIEKAEKEGKKVIYRTRRYKINS